MIATSIALSGLHAANDRLAASAHNVANLATPGFRRQLAVPHTMPAGGVGTTVQRAPVPGASLAVDLVQQMAAGHAFKANLYTVQTEQRMLGALLDLKA